MAMIAAIVVVAVATDTFSDPIGSGLLERWGFGLADLRAGRLLNLLLAPFQILQPYILLTVTSSLFVFGVGCETLWGTRRTALAFWLSHVAGYVVTLLFLWGMGSLGVDWARVLASQRDVGASNGVFGAAGALAAGLPRRAARWTISLLVVFLGGLLIVSHEIWDFQHLIALAVGLGLGSWFLRSQGGAWPDLLPRFHPDRRQQALFLSWGLGMLGVLDILTAFIAPHHPRIATLEAWLSTSHAPRHLLLVLGVSMVLLARGLGRRRRAAWWGAMVALAFTFLLQFLIGPRRVGALWAGLLVIPLVLWRPVFTTPTSPPSFRQGLVGLGWLAMGIPLYGLLGFFVFRHAFSEPFHPGTAVLETGQRLLFLDGSDSTSVRAAWFVRSIPVLGWSGLLVSLGQFLRGALAPRRVLEDDAQGRDLLQAYGRTGTAYMTLWKGNALFLPDSRDSYVAYRVNTGVAVALGDPVGPPERLDATLRAFAAFCERQGWDPAFFAISFDTVAAYRKAGYRLLQIGEEAVIALESLEFRGKHWQTMRSAMNRAQREGISFRMFEGGTVPPDLRARIVALGEAWLSEKGLPPMEFTLGRTEDIDDPDITVAVAVDAKGKVLAFADWLPVYARQGWVIDLMRRDPEAVGGVMEFLIGMSLLTFKERGYRQASLGAAPLADLDRSADASLVQRALGAVYERSETFYNFKTLFQFKERFQPRWEAVYLAHTGMAKLPRVALSILRAHLPTLDLVRATTLLGESVAEHLSQDTGIGDGGTTENPPEEPPD